MSPKIVRHVKSIKLGEYLGPSSNKNSNEELKLERSIEWNVAILNTIYHGQIIPIILNTQWRHSTWEKIDIPIQTIGINTMNGKCISPDKLISKALSKT